MVKEGFTMGDIGFSRAELIKNLSGKNIFVTGGTGSFGKTFVRLCLSNKDIASVTVFSRDEQKHVSLRRDIADPRLRTVIGDVRDIERLRYAMRGADMVFNAAAIKHVHLAEEHPMEAVKTNVLGAYNVCHVAVELGVEAVVTLSTDKAVEPVNVMGMSKALQERITSSFCGGKTRFGVVRYGNVLASNGSVIPYFKKLIEGGEPILPVTDKRMTRFVLTLEDSVDLVLFAMRECKNGEIYVLDMPAFHISDVADVMATQAGNLGWKVSVSEVGIRPGEKLHETLISSEEMRHAKKFGGMWRIEPCLSSETIYAAGTEETAFSSDVAVRLTKQQIAALLARESCFPTLRGKGF